LINKELFYIFAINVKLENMTVSEVDIKHEIKEIVGVEAVNLMSMGLIEPKQAVRWLVRRQYFALAKTGRTYTDIKYELSERYGISVSSIEKMIYRKP
jgi:hypothetical protein